MYISKLKQLYQTEIINYFVNSLHFDNVMKIPKIIKIVINMGMGVKGNNNVYFSNSFNEMIAITGQKPQIIKAKKSISSFCLRKGTKIGLRTTLRNDVMYDFLYKFINISIPRIKEFRGFNKSAFDDCGNFNFGISDHNIFVEIFSLNKIIEPKGMDINICISNNSPRYSYLLLRKFNIPFING